MAHRRAAVSRRPPPDDGERIVCPIALVLAFAFFNVGAEIARIAIVSIADPLLLPVDRPAALGVGCDKIATYEVGHRAARRPRHFPLA